MSFRNDRKSKVSNSSIIFFSYLGKHIRRIPNGKKTTKSRNNYVNILHSCISIPLKGFPNFKNEYISNLFAPSYRFHLEYLLELKYNAYWNEEEILSEKIIKKVLPIKMAKNHKIFSKNRTKKKIERVSICITEWWLSLLFK